MRIQVDDYTEIPYSASVHTVVETPAFLASAKDEGLGDDERLAIVAHLARHPNAGDLMPGTGGARKVRFAGRGKGKSGGYRVVTFYGGNDIPVFLLDVYGKDTQANLSRAARNELRRMLTALPEAWRTEAARRTRTGSKR
jgi:hypothetical protein